MAIINFINFITRLVWSVISLFGSMILCCVCFAICWMLLLAIAEIVRKDANERFNVWQVIDEYEREEYESRD